MTVIEDGKISLKTFAIILVGAVSATFSLTTIYSQFILQDEFIKEVYNEVIRVEGRMDKITDRNKKSIQELEERILTLELPNSDEEE